MRRLEGVRGTLEALWVLRRHLRVGRWLVIAVVVVSGLLAMCEALALALIGSLVLLIVDPGEGTHAVGPAWMGVQYDPARRLESLGLLSVAAFLSMLGKNGMGYLGAVLSGTMKRRVMIHLRGDLFWHLLHAPLRVFEERKTGEVAGVFLNDVIRAYSAIEAILLATQRGCMCVAYLGVLVYISPAITLLTVVVAMLSTLPNLLLQRRVATIGAANLAAYADFSADLSEGLGGVRVTRAAHGQEQQMARFAASNRRHALAEEQYIRFSGMMLPLMETLVVASGIGILMVASRLVDGGQIEGGQLMTYGLVLMRMLPILSQLNAHGVTIAYHGPNVRELLRWFAIPTYPSQPFGDEPFETVRESIRFENVGFTYESGKQAVTDVSFEIPSGAMVALVGASGSGKSTLAALLLRLRAPTEGRILVDGRDYWRLSPETWHRRVSLVEQEAFLFNDTIAANVTFGCPDASPADLDEAIRVAHLEGVVAGLPQGLKTVVGERGVALSGGQRQRLAIARAVVRRPEILVLDEATSALDNVSERHVQQALESARRNRTVVVIAHRLSTVRNADRIVVLEEGRVAEVGAWDELLARKGAFRRLVEASQRGGGDGGGDGLLLDSHGAEARAANSARV